MLRDVRSFFNKLLVISSKLNSILCRLEYDRTVIGKKEETKTSNYSPSMATRVTQAASAQGSRTVTPIGTPELP